MDPVELINGTMIRPWMQVVLTYFYVIMAVVICSTLFEAPAAEVEATPMFVSPLPTSTMLHSKATIKVDYN